MALLKPASLISLLTSGGVRTKGHLNDVLELGRTSGVDPRKIGDMLRNHGVPINWSPVSTIKMRVPLNEHELVVTPSGNPLGKAGKVSLDDLHGGIIIPAIGDRTRAGVTLHEVNGTKLSQPVDLEGGARFSQAKKNKKQGSVWASGESVTSRIQNKINDLAERYPGVRQYLMHTSMAGTSSDFATMNADVLMGLIEANGLSKAAASAIDDMMQNGVAALNAKKLKGPPVKWDGIRDKDARGLLRNSSQLRKLLMEGLSPADMQSIESMPDIGAIRHATTDPDLVMTPNMTTGLSVSEVTPGAAINSSPDVPHLSYDTHLKGKYLGELKTLLPGHVAYPDFEEIYGLYSPSNKEYTFRLNMPHQRMDDQWREGVEAFLKRGRK